MVGDLPPSSSDVGISFSAARRCMPMPTVVPPVKAMRLISGCFTSASPTTLPLPGNTLMMPSGTPACCAILASSIAMRGVISAGLNTMAQPAARAGASFCASLAMGLFQGVMAPTTPSGSCTLMLKKSPREGVMVSSQISAAAPKNWKVPAALATSARHSLMGLPLSRRCRCASSSLRSRMPAAMR